MITTKRTEMIITFQWDVLKDSIAWGPVPKSAKVRKPDEVMEFYMAALCANKPVPLPEHDGLYFVTCGEWGAGHAKFTAIKVHP